MAKCPFWSNKKIRVGCDSDCPLSPKNNNKEECLFIEHLSEESNIYKEIIEEDFSYSKVDDVEFNIGSYKEY